MAKENAPTLIDVAEKAGVNKVTVSVVLNGSQANTRVSNATRERILAAAKELNYQPNALARSLRRRQTNIIGFYMGGFMDTRNLFLSEIVSGLQQGCELNCRDFLMHGTFRGASTDDIYAELVNGKVDGLILHVRGNNPLVQRLADSYLPVIAITDAVPSLPSVTIDDVAGSRLLAQHLAEKGHRRILYGTSPFPLASVHRRHAAFCEAASDLGMTVVTDLARHDDLLPSPLEARFLALTPRERPTAVVCWNDNFAYLMIEYFRRSGIRVPEDLAVTGFDGSTTAIPPAYRLTTILAPWRQVAQTAVSLLIAQKEGNPPPAETMLPVEFMLGETT